MRRRPRTQDSLAHFVLTQQKLLPGHVPGTRRRQFLLLLRHTLVRESQKSNMPRCPEPGERSKSVRFGRRLRRRVQRKKELSRGLPDVTARDRALSQAPPPRPSAFWPSGRTAPSSGAGAEAPVPALAGRAERFRCPCRVDVPQTLHARLQTRLGRSCLEADAKVPFPLPERGSQGGPDGATAPHAGTEDLRSPVRTYHTTCPSRPG